MHDFQLQRQYSSICSALMTTGEMEFPIELTNASSSCCITFIATGGALLPKELTKTMLQLSSNPHTSRRTMVSNSTETSLQLLFHPHNDRQSMTFYTRNNEHAPAVVQLS